MNLAFNINPQKNAQNHDAFQSKILFITECSSWGKLGYETVSNAFSSVLPVYWSFGMPKPDLGHWHGDWIVSFKSDLILSRTMLDRATKGAINFHPSPPKYRGLGGYWWALHNNDNTFGVTCHHMNERIDHGTIIATKNFPIWPQETVESLKHRSALYSLILLNETLDIILSGKALMPCGREWAEHLYTRKELVLAQNAYKAKGARVALESILNEMSDPKAEENKKALQKMTG